MSLEVGDVVKVVLDHAMLNTSAVQSVFHFLVTSGSADGSDVMDDWLDWAENVWGADWSPAASADALITQVSVDKVDFAGHVLESFGAASLTVPGTGSGKTVSSDFSGLMYAATALPKNRGMKYVPGLDADGVDENEIKSVLLGLLTQLAAVYLSEYVGAVSSARYMPGVNSRTENDFLPFVGTAVVTEIPANQTRRKRNRGA